MNERIKELPLPQRARRGPAPFRSPPPPIPTTRWGQGRVSRDRSLARAREAARGQRWRAGSRCARARGREGRGRATGKLLASGCVAGCCGGGGGGSGGGWWPPERAPGGRRRRCGDAAASVRSAEEAAALEAPESAEELLAGVGGFGRPPGHGGRGRWLAR